MRNLKLSFSKEDLKMKKLLLNLLVFMSNDLAALQVNHTLIISVIIWLNIVKHINMMSSNTDSSLCVFLSQLYREERVMLALLTLVKPPPSPSERRSGPHHWSSVQQEELQLQALATLATVAPLMLDGYMSCQGNTCLLLLLDWCIRQGEDTAKHGERRAQPKTSCQSALEQNPL